MTDHITWGSASYALALAKRAVILVRRYSYKPTITMEVTPDMGGFPILHMQMLVPDSRQQVTRRSIHDDESFFPTIRDSYFYDDDSGMVRRSSGFPTRTRSLNPDGRSIVPVQATWSIPPEILAEGEEESFGRWLFAKIVDLELHEAKEWFRLDGEIVDDPHHPTGRLA